MKTSTNMTLNGTIVGSNFQYDVATKARATKILLGGLRDLQGLGLSKKEFIQKKNELILTLADYYIVTPPTIKAWMKKYYYTYKEYETLPSGVMRMANSLFSGEKVVRKAKKFLVNQKSEREVYITNVDPDYAYKKGVSLSYKEIEELQY